MKIFFVLAILISWIASNAQTRQDSLTMLEQKATLYLSTMYQEQNFESAVHSWYDSTFAEIEELYKKQNKLVAGVAALKDFVKSDYEKFYTTHKNFKVLKQGKGQLEKVNNNLMAYFDYSYTEQFNEKWLISTSYLYFIFDTAISEWKVFDFRIPSILGSTTDWMR